MMALEAPMPSGWRTLTVTGDDFGLTPGINAGIVHAHEDGILTHASLMPAAEFARDAVDLAARTPTLSVGVHLGLVDGRPTLPPRRGSTLVEADGRFRPTAFGFIRDWVAMRVDLHEVERELRAQVERTLSLGVTPTHLDSHKHIHMWPPIFEIVTRLAVEYRIPAVRIAFERPAWLLVHERRRDAALRGQALSNIYMSPLAWFDRRVLLEAGIQPAWFVGRVETGHLTLGGLERMLGRLLPGRTELMTHPGYVDEHLARVKTRLRLEREREAGLLCAPATRRLVERHAIALTRRPAAAVTREWSCIDGRCLC